MSATALAQDLEAIFAGELEEQLRAAVDMLPNLSSRGARDGACRQLARIFHTIKGGAGLVGRADLAEAAEAFEHFFADPHQAPVPTQQAMDLLCAAAALDPPRLDPGVTEARGATPAPRRGAAEEGESSPPAPARHADISQVPFARLESLLRTVTRLVIGQIQIEERSRTVRRACDRLLDEHRRPLEWSASTKRPAAGQAAAAVDRAEELRDLTDALAEQAAGAVRDTIRLRRQLEGLWPVSDAARAPVERVVVVECGPQMLALPFGSVEGGTTLPASAVREVVERGVLPLDGTLVPVLALGRLIGEPLPHDHAVAVTVSDAGRRAALLVDRVRAHLDLIVQPLHRALASHPFLRATTIGSSGQVILILDTGKLVRAASGAGPLSAWQRAQREPGDGAVAARAVLVVDDSITVRRLIADVLEAAGLDFDLAADGQDALEKLAARPFRLVLTDLEMPRMDGFELIGTLRRDPRWHAQPVVVCTSRSRDHHRERIRALGVVGCVTKPFTREQLLGEVRRALEGG